MIQMQTSLAVADNSGAKRVEMIAPIGGSTAKIAPLGAKAFSPVGWNQKTSPSNWVNGQVNRLGPATSARPSSAETTSTVP